MGLAFSTCHIYKILIVKQWGVNPNLSREFSEPSKPRFFNYWDYQRAWFNAFLIQNRDFHHSWMFYFPSKNQLSSFPFWFTIGVLIMVRLLRFFLSPFWMALSYLEVLLIFPENFQLFPFYYSFSANLALLG